MLTHITDAQDKGGKLSRSLEEIQALGGNFLKPVVISNVDLNMKVMHEETFGPVAPIMTYDDLDEVIDIANDTEFEQCLKDIPQIIHNPDYISIHPTDESVSFIKKYSKHVSVAIKISTDGKMVYRTMYPLREAQLNEYIKNGRAWKYC